MGAKIVPLNERGAAYLKDLEERAEREARRQELERYVFLFGERPAPTYTLTDWFRGQKD